MELPDNNTPCSTCGAVPSVTPGMGESGPLCLDCFKKYGNYHPGWMQKLKNITITVAQWAAAGYPRRDPEEVKELFNDYCSVCPVDAFDPDMRVPHIPVRIGGCRLCGCHMSEDARDLANGLTFPNKPCPAGLFSAPVDDPRVTPQTNGLEQSDDGE